MTVVTGRHRGSKEFLLVYSELISAARFRGLTTYQALAQLIGLPRSGSHMAREIGQILGEISEDEVANGRPMLSALAVGVSGVPGEGFYGLARDWGRLSEDSREADLAFWERERSAVYAAWARTFKD